MRLVSFDFYNKAMENSRAVEHLREMIKKLEQKDHDFNMKVLDETSKIRDEFEFKEKKAVAALEARLEKDKLHMEREFMAKQQEFANKHLEDNFDKLSKSLAKLHEEGNVTTKYMHDLTMKLADSWAPSNIKQVGHDGNDR